MSKRIKTKKVRYFVGVQYGLDMPFTTRSTMTEVWRYLMKSYLKEPVSKDYLQSAGWQVVPLVGSITHTIIRRTRKASP